MRAVLVVVAITSTAWAERRVNQLANQPATICRPRGSWWAIGTIDSTDRGAWELGAGFVAGANDAVPTVHVGYHASDEILLRVRQRIDAHEAEVAFAAIRAELRVRQHRARGAIVVLAGGGITNAGDGLGYLGLAVRAMPIAGVDWVTIEAGLRQRLEISEGFLAISIVH